MKWLTTRPVLKYPTHIRKSAFAVNWPLSLNKVFKLPDPKSDNYGPISKERVSLLWSFYKMEEMLCK